MFDVPRVKKHFLRHAAIKEILSAATFFLSERNFSEGLRSSINAQFTFLKSEAFQYDHFKHDVFLLFKSINLGMLELSI